ncbi:MAG: DUF3048 domain-containing protein [Chloroflexota bacterium]
MAAAGGLVGAALVPRIARAQVESPPESPEEPQQEALPEEAPQAARPIIVQIDNDPRARPSSNLGAARYVYEYTAEGGVTRFSAVYVDQDDVGTIGNVRSARLPTIEIVQQFNGILAYHGGATGIQEHIWQSWIDFISFELVENYPFFTRVPWRVAPYNSYTDLPRMREAAQAREISLLGPAKEYFPQGPYEPAGAQPVNRIALPYPPGFDVVYEYDPATNAYWRFMAGRPHWDDGLNAQVTTQNVIVQFVPSFLTDIIEDIYGSRSLDYRLQGSGPAWIFRDGLLVETTWHRADPLHFTAFYDVLGRNVPLAPGTAWISLVAPDAPVRAWYEA